MIKFSFIALGCSKNTVDAEQMLYILEQQGMKNVVTPDVADVVIINTCGFIEAAKSEAIENILEMAELKEEGVLQKIVVTGCLAQRYREEILTDLPEVDGVVGSASLGDIAQAVRDVMDGQRICLVGDKDAPLVERQRVLSTPFYTAYVKIAEGCDNCCSYCAIPMIKGKFRSRELASIVDECAALAKKGVREIILIAQDTTRYGLDLYGHRALGELIDAVCAIDDIVWVRLHYLYPDGFDESLIKVIARQNKVVKYLDIPMQHASDRLLSSMNRRYTEADLRRLLATLRAAIPGVVLRTSLIVGYPGESEQDFEVLCRFLKDAKIDRVGAFAYSAEEGTAAALLPQQVEESLKQSRLETVYTLQADIMEDYNRACIGKTMTVLNDGYDELCEVYAGRSFADSPDIDGRVF